MQKDKRKAKQRIAIIITYSFKIYILCGPMMWICLLFEEKKNTDIFFFLWRGESDIYLKYYLILLPNFA